MLALALALLLRPVSAAEWKAPSKAETGNLAMLMGRLKHKRYGAAVISEKKLRTVDEAAASLEKAVEIPVACPKGKRVFKVRTELKAWTDRSETDGWYEWGGVSGESDDDGNAAFVNVLAIDPAAIERGEKSVFGQVDDVRILYHELLHAQLLIDAAKSDEAWRKDFCAKGEPDLSPADLKNPHKVIPKIEKPFGDALWEKVQFEKTPWSAKED